MARRGAMQMLEPYRSWSLERISPTTYPYDILVRLKKNGQIFSPEMEAEIASLIKQRTCYRCRIGRGPYYFAASALDAARLAINAKVQA